MVAQYRQDRVSIFIDGNNMFYAQRSNGWFFDPRKVLEYFNRHEALVNAFWYTGIRDPQDQRGFRDALIAMGFTVREKFLKEYYDRLRGDDPEGQSRHRNCRRHVQHRRPVQPCGALQRRRRL